MGKPDYCKITSVRMCDLSVQSTCGYKNRVVRVQYAHTTLMTQFASRTLYAVPRVRVKSEVYFGLKSQRVITESCGCLQSAVSKHIKCKVDWKEEFG